ncbi:MAG: cytochrome c [Pseudomonadota bacterium]
MRVLVIAATCVLVACGGSQSSQANNADSNAAAANATAAAVAAPVSGAKAAAIMRERHEGMEAIGKATKQLRRELGGGSPDIAAVRGSAAKIAGLSKKASGWFPAGTGPDVGKTGAKPEIWQDPKDFAAKLASFQRAAAAFNGAASGGDESTIQARYSDLGGTCKACHDKYRAETNR